MFDLNSKNRLIFKIGGKILRNLEVLNPLLTLFNDFSQHSFDKKSQFRSEPFKVLLICGGGLCAENLRTIYKNDTNKTKNNDEYHWNAIGCMDENATKIYNIIINEAKNKSMIKNIHLTDNIEEYIKNQSGLFFYKPLKDLKVWDPLELPHSWEVTSDSITIYIASKLGIKTPILLKEREFFELNNKIYNKIKADDLESLMEEFGYNRNIDKHLGKGTTFPIDPYSTKLVRNFNMKVLLMGGFNVQKIKSFLEKSAKLTKIKYKEFGTLIVS